MRTNSIGSLGFLAFWLESLANEESHLMTKGSKNGEEGVYVLLASSQIS